MNLAARIEAGTCECGAELRRTQTPVTIGGWYGDFQYAWVDGRVKVIDAVCRRCKERRLYTPVAVPEGLQDFLGVVTFAGALAQMKPDVLDVIDFDAKLRAYADALGVDPDTLVSPDRVQELRAARARARVAACRAAPRFRA